jgi:hypothetical protein
MRAKMEEEARASIELEDISLGQLWTDTDIPFLSDPLEDLPSLTLISDREEFKTEMVSEVFNENSKHLSLSVSRIPEAVVQAKREEIERQVQEERLIMLEKLRKREEDIDYREMSAKDAVQAKEREARRRLDAEKQKVASLSLKKQKNLAQDFKKMREELEVGIKRQQGAVKEHFGKMLVHEEVKSCHFYFYVFLCQSYLLLYLLLFFTNLVDPCQAISSLVKDVSSTSRVPHPPFARCEEQVAQGLLRVDADTIRQPRRPPAQLVPHRCEWDRQPSAGDHPQLQARRALL